MKSSHNLYAPCTLLPFTLRCPILPVTYSNFWLILWATVLRDSMTDCLIFEKLPGNCAVRNPLQYCNASILRIMHSIRTSQNTSRLILTSYYHHNHRCITCMHGIYNCVPETNHVYSVYTVTAVLYLQSVPHVMLFRPCCMFCTVTLALPAVCVQRPIWLLLFAVP